MRALILGCVAAFLLPSGARAGVIEGTVRAEGVQGVAAGQSSGAYDSKKFKFAERVDYSQMRDFIIYLEGPFKEKPVPPSKPVQVVTQKGAMFTPHVLPILVGTTVEWPNQDEIFHNVFSDSDAAQFNLGLYQGTKPWKFEKPGRVDVFCSIHSKMHCILMVLETPYFTVSDKNNRYVLKDVPAGTYTLKVWHERMPSLTQQVTVPEGKNGTVNLNLVLGIKTSPLP